MRDCWPRPIVDYTFSGVNETTVNLAPPESWQFRKALDRIIQNIAGIDPQHGTVSFSKYNLADTIMSVSLSASMILELAVAVPNTLLDKYPIIAVSMVHPCPNLT
jgi:hypothetical protein